MFRKYAVAMSLGLILAASCGTLGASWTRPEGMVPVTDAVADQVAGGQAYCTPHYLNNGPGCNLTGCPGNRCGAIYIQGGGGPAINGYCYVQLACYVCGINCGYCNAVAPCAGS
jgi:hypothetical protein